MRACVCHNEKKGPDEWQARQATPAILQVNSSKHNAKKITTSVCVYSWVYTSRFINFFSNICSSVGQSRSLPVFISLHYILRYRRLGRAIFAFRPGVYIIMINSFINPSTLYDNFPLFVVCCPARNGLFHRDIKPENILVRVRSTFWLCVHQTGIFYKVLIIWTPCDVLFQHLLHSRWNTEKACQPLWDRPLMITLCFKTFWSCQKASEDPARHPAVLNCTLQYW